MPKTGSLLDTTLDVCYNKTPIRIKNDHFQYGPNRNRELEIVGL